MIEAAFSDIRKNPLLSVAVAAFAFTSCFLITLGILKLGNLMTRLDSIMEKAEVPHFLQMHAGGIDDADFSQFAELEDVIDFQIVPYLNIDNNEFLFEGAPFIKGSDDNGVCVQPPRFDFLLSEEGDVLEADDEEVFVPECYSPYVSEGGSLSIAGIPLKVRGFLVDAQMGSSLSSSKRFLVSEETCSRLLERGRLEYLIEARGMDASSGSKLADAYASLPLPSNGPAVTYSLIRMMNALSEGVMIILIMLSGIIAMAISLISLRFIFLISAERDDRRIAIMKAIGVRKRTIIMSYALRYSALMAAGAVLSALILCFALKRMLSCIIAHALLFSLLVLWSLFVLRHVADKDIIASMRMNGRTRSLRSALVLLSLLSALMYFLSYLPGGAASTLSSKTFVSSMGIGEADIRIDLKGESRDEVEEYLASSPYCDRFALYDTCRVIISTSGSDASLLAEAGDYSAFPLRYSEGRYPDKSNEIALSTLLSEDLGASVGDAVSIGGREYHVVGIYGDITNGGRTAKTVDPLGDTAWSIAYADSSEPERLLADIRTLFPLAKADTIDSYIENLYGRTIRNIDKASKAAFASAMLIEIILVILIASLSIARDKRSIMLRLSLGIRHMRIIMPYIARILLSVAAGIAIGIVISSMLGPALLSLMLSFLGASGVSFAYSPLFSFLILPSAMIILAAISAMAGAMSAFRIKAVDIRSTML